MINAGTPITLIHLFYIILYEVTIFPIVWRISSGTFLDRAEYNSTRLYFEIHFYIIILEALCQIMNDLFDNVIYAGIDTDKHKYPIGKCIYCIRSISLRDKDYLHLHWPILAVEYNTLNPEINAPDVHLKFSIWGEHLLEWGVSKREAFIQKFRNFSLIFILKTAQHHPLH